MNNQWREMGEVRASIVSSSDLQSPSANQERAKQTRPGIQEQLKSSVSSDECIPVPRKQGNIGRVGPESSQ